MAFDTHASVKKLQEAGFTPQQAEAQVELVRTVVEENLATKQDLRELEGRIEVRFKEVEHKIELLRRDLLIKLGGIVVVCFTLLAAMIGVVIALVAL